MSCHQDRVRHYKGVIKKAVPGLDSEQIEAIWAIWTYANTDTEFVLRSYLSNETDLSQGEVAEIINALQRSGILLF